MSATENHSYRAPRFARVRRAVNLLRREPLRHSLHYWWNGSRFNRKYRPFVSSCSCCCIWCEDE